MDIMELGAIGELVGGAAVIGSLLYVGTQVRQSNRQNTAAAVKDTIKELVGAFAALTADEAAAENFRAGMDHFEEMDPNQQCVFHSKMQTLANGYYQVWRLNQLALLPDSDFTASRDLFVRILKTRGGRQWWSIWKHLPPEPYTAGLDELLTDTTSSVPPAKESLPWFRYEQPA